MDPLFVHFDDHLIVRFERNVAHASRAVAARVAGEGTLSDVERTYSVEEAALQIIGTDTPAKVRWLMVRLRTGDLPGYKADRKWRMTESDITAAIDKLRPPPAVEPPMSSIVAGMTPRSRRKFLGR